MMMLRYLPAAGVIPQPKQHDFNLFKTEEVIRLLLDLTNLQWRHSITEWRDVDAADLRLYMVLLFHTCVYWS